MSRAPVRQSCIAVLAALVWCQGFAWSQLVKTDDPTDLAIEGPGWFVLRDPATGQNYVTRTGNFYVDAAGYLAWTALRVQGYNDATLSTVGDLKVDPTGAPNESSSPITSWDFDSAGRLNVTLADNTAFVRGQLLLQNFRVPELLTREAHNLYGPTPGANPLERPAAPGSSGLGKLLTGWLDSTPEPVRLSLLPSASRVGPLSEGVLTATPVPTDLGIKGPGFFLVRDTNNSNVFATRAGLFLRDGEGYLITYDGLRVQGYSDPAFTLEGDVRIDSAGAPGGAPESGLYWFWFDANGQIKVISNDGSVFSRGQILLRVFAHPDQLTAMNHGRYGGVAQARPQLVTSSSLHQGTLELINVPTDLLSLRHKLSFFSQGYIAGDGVGTHLAISGSGFFVLRSPSTGIQYATRAGAFHLDDQGYLINVEGLRVQGYATPGLTSIGDLRVDSAGSPSAVNSLSIDSKGELKVILADGTSFVCGQVLLQTFGQSFLLKETGANLYTNLAAALPLPQPGAPSTGNLGRICSGALEFPGFGEQLTPPSRYGIRIRVTGEPGRNWTIQAADKLGRWTTINQITNVPDELEFTDTDSESFSQRFYRVLISEP